MIRIYSKIGFFTDWSRVRDGWSNGFRTMSDKRFLNYLEFHRKRGVRIESQY